MRLWKSADRYWRLPTLPLAAITMMAAGAGLTAMTTMTVTPANAAEKQKPDGTASASVAWLRDGKLEMRSLVSQERLPDATQNEISDSKSLEQKVPMGSLWKLFVYAYLEDQHVQEPAYVCAVKKDAGIKQSSKQDNKQNSQPNKNEDLYCCEPGEQVERNTALARSCAPYFSPARLGLTDKNWKAYWQEHSAASWLQRPAQLQPDTQVSLRDLLSTLDKFSPQARNSARTALLETALQGYGREAWAQLGTGLRYKTYSWHLPDGTAFGGAAGWLADGTPFWFGARGSSRSTLATWANALAAALPAPRWSDIATADSADYAGDNAQCVDVDFFARYPLREVLSLSGIKPAPARAGSMNGKYRLQFSNNNSLDINAGGNGRLSLQRSPGMPAQITGRFTINDYVARVIDREGDGSNTEVARALAIAARSYLMQNASLEHACWRIADTTNRQRVSANPPSEAALAAAWFTSDLVLQAANIRYHNEQAGPNRMSLKDANKQASQGWNFERILATSYPQASIASINGKSDCQPLTAAQTWLSMAADKWHSQLRSEPGFESLDKAPAVCSLATGNPYSDQQRMRIYVRGWRSLNERITLAHEYLHLALRFHPNGANEQYVEKLARRLIEGSI